MALTDIAIASDGTIAGISDTMEPWAKGIVNEINARGLVALPGTVNAHCLVDLPRGRAHSREAVVAHSIAIMRRMLVAGTTTACFVAPERADAVAEAAVRVGMRAVVAPVVRDHKDSSMMDPSAGAQRDLDRVVAFARRWGPYRTVSVAVGLCVLWSSRPPYIEAVLGGAHARGLALHAYGEDDAGVVAVLASFGSWPRPTTFSAALREPVMASCHARMLAASGASVVCCCGGNDRAALASASNSNRAVCGAAAPVALGSDVGNLFDRMQQRAKIAAEPPDWTRLWSMAAGGAAKAIGLDHKGVGRLRVGGVADMMLVDSRRFARSIATLSTDKALQTIAEHVRPSDVVCVFVDGRVVAAGQRTTLFGQ
jgi:cytosine/adenosine deaminase-related metal-dependent hydrolase